MLTADHGEFTVAISTEMAGGEELMRGGWRVSGTPAGAQDEI